MMNNLIPPNDPELEKAIVGAFIIESNAIIEHKVKPEWFYTEGNQWIIEAVLSLAKEGIPVDLIQVTMQLRKSDKLNAMGGPFMLSKAISAVASAANLKYHLRVLQDLYIRRELAKKSLLQHSRSYDLTIDVETLLVEAQNNTLSLLEFEENDVVNVSDSIGKVIDQAKRNQEGSNLTGIGTGLRKLDNFTNGMQKGDLWIIAGETSQGKTALGVTILKNAVYSYGARAVVYSLEMTHPQLTARIMAQETKIPVKTILHGYLNEPEMNLLESCQQRHKKSTLLFDEKANNSIDSICASIRRLKLKYKINLAMVDYLQIVSGNEKKTDEGKLADISRKLKNVARELEITVIAISQLSRNMDRPEPSISRLRGSGQLEEAADLVILLYRPEVYGKTYNKNFGNITTTNTAQIKIAKGRNVGTGSFIASFNPQITGFSDYVPEGAGDPDKFIESNNNPF